MNGFTSIDFDSFFHKFFDEEKAGRRLKIGELQTSLWLKENEINLDDVRELSFHLPDSKFIIIGSGNLNGFYIYSEKLKKCFKNYPVYKTEAI